MFTPCFRHMKLLDNPRYVLQDGKGVGNFYLQVFDLAGSNVIREAKLVSYILDSRQCSISSNVSFNCL